MSDDEAQELQISIGLQAMNVVDELMPSRPATLRDPVSPDQIVVEYPKLTYFPSQPWFKRCPVDETLPRSEQSKIDAVLSQLQFDFWIHGRSTCFADRLFPVRHGRIFWSHICFSYSQISCPIYCTVCMYTASRSVHVQCAL